MGRAGAQMLHRNGIGHVKQIYKRSAVDDLERCSPTSPTLQKIRTKGISSVATERTDEASYSALDMLVPNL